MIGGHRIPLNAVRISRHCDLLLSSRCACFISCPLIAGLIVIITILTPGAYSYKIYYGNNKGLTEVPGYI